MGSGEGHWGEGPGELPLPAQEVLYDTSLWGCSLSGIAGGLSH